MIATEHAQSLAEFRDAAAETLERVNRTGEPEAITVDGEVRAMLVPPELYRGMAKEFWLARDVTAIRRSTADFEAGRHQTVQEVSDELRATLLAMKTERNETAKQ